MNRYLLLILLLFIACNQIGRVYTPQEYVNNVKVEYSLYSKDSVSIVNELYSTMRNHEGAFKNREYFDSTKLYLDRVFYDSSKNKIAFFVIAENPVERNPYSHSALPYYYNADCYLGKRLQNDSNRFQVANIGPAHIINFDDKESASQAIRDIYCSQLTTFLDVDGTPHYNFNVNDKRFWTSLKGWQRVFQ
jgi:hypothetical protein